MNPKHKLIEIVFGPIANYFESIYVTKWIVAVLFNGLIAYLIFRGRKKGDNIKAKEVIILLAVLLGLGYAIYDQFLILQTLFNK
jgi:hypothetical protein